MSQALIASHLRRRIASHGFGITQQLAYATGGASSSKVKEIVNTVDWDTLITNSSTNNRPIVVEFTAAWCPPCKMIAPILEGLAEKHTDVDFVKLDIDNSSVTPVVADFECLAVPTFVSLRDGKRVTTFSGADRTALAKMVEDLSSL